MLGPCCPVDPVVVRITSEANELAWQVNDQPLASLAELRGLLEKLASIKRDAPVILHPDPFVSLGHVIEVYDLSRLVGFEKVQFAADSHGSIAVHLLRVLGQLAGTQHSFRRLYPYLSTGKY